MTYQWPWEQPDDRLPDRDPHGRELRHIAHLLASLEQKVDLMSIEIDRLKQSVSELVTVDASVEALLTQLSDALHAAAEDPAQVNAIADQIDAEKSNLANAVLLNTPPVVGTVPDPTPTGPTGPVDVPPVTSSTALYTVDGDVNTDTANFTASSFTTNDTPPRPLFTFGGDTTDGIAHGDGTDGTYHTYTGTLLAA